MRYFFSFLITSVVCATFLSCTGPSASLRMGEELKQYGVAEKDIEAFQRGKTLAVMECSNCHRFFRSEEYLPEEWEAIIRNHAQRLSLDKQQSADINFYFQVMSEPR